MHVHVHVHVLHKLMCVCNIIIESLTLWDTLENLAMVIVSKTNEIDAL